MKFSMLDLVTFGQKLTQVFTGRNFGATEAVSQRCSIKKVFLEISQTHRKTPVPESLFK